MTYPILLPIKHEMRYVILSLSSYLILYPTNQTWLYWTTIKVKLETTRNRIFPLSSYIMLYPTNQTWLYWTTIKVKLETTRSRSFLLHSNCNLLPIIEQPSKLNLRLLERVFPLHSNPNLLLVKHVGLPPIKHY